MADILSQNPRWWQESLKYYHRAFHLDPENPEILIDVAHLSLKLEMRAFAEKALIRALHIKPDHKKAKALLHRIHKK